MYEIIDINFILKHLLPKEVKVDTSVDNVRITSNSINNQSLIFTEKSFYIQFRFH